LLDSRGLNIFFNNFFSLFNNRDCCLSTEAVLLVDRGERGLSVLFAKGNFHLLDELVKLLGGGLGGRENAVCGHYES
jgi:hypothetical protein